MDAQNIIHFVGLIVLSTQLSAKHQLQAVLPAVIHRGAQVMANMDATQKDAPGVENHIAVLVFGKGDYNGRQSVWKPSKLPQSNAYVYVRLNHEHIRIVPTVSPTAINTKTLSSEEESDLQKLPHLLKGKELREEYKESTNFAKAAAVFDLPAGRAHGCTYGWRVDMQWIVPNNGPLSIQEQQPDKTWVTKLILNKGARLYVGNVPWSSFWGGTRPTNGVSHFHVYYDMTTSGSPPPNESYSTSFSQCQPPAPIDGEHASAVGVPLPYGSNAAGTDFQCSAITWP